MLTAQDETTATAGSADAPAVAPQTYTGIAILGSHPATVMNAPFGDASWLIYACSPHNVEQRTLPRVDQWFELHDTIEDVTRAFGYLKAVSEMPFVWMRDKRALASGLFKGAREYPETLLKGTSTIQDIKAGTGQYRQVAGPDGKPAMAEVMERRRVEVPNNDGLFCPYMFTSSIAYMLAKAIWDIEELKKNAQMGGSSILPSIGLWGIMQASDTEYCAAPQTRALTSDLRWIPVGDLKVGDELIAFDENPGYSATGWGSDPTEKKANGATDAFRKYRHAVVDATGEIKMPCYRFIMADGTELISSANHKWLNREAKWIESRHVRDAAQYPGATQIMKLMDPWEEELTWEAGYLAAAVDGEGCLSQMRHDGRDIVKLAFAQKENAMRDEVYRAARSYGFEFVQGSGGGGIEHVLKGGKRAVLEFLGRFRPPRLMKKFDPSRVGTMHRKEFVPVEKAEYIGEQTVIALSTTTGTFIAEGFASHNTYQRPGIQYFLGEAMRRGIKVIANRESCLFDMPQWKW